MSGLSSIYPPRRRAPRPRGRLLARPQQCDETLCASGMETPPLSSWHVWWERAGCQSQTTVGGTLYSCLPLTPLNAIVILEDVSRGRRDGWIQGVWRNPGKECAAASPTVNGVISSMWPTGRLMGGWNEVENRSLWLRTQLHHAHKWTSSWCLDHFVQQEWPGQPMPGPF